MRSLDTYIAILVLKEVQSNITENDLKKIRKYYIR